MSCQTWTTCSSEPVLAERVTAARAAKAASSEPSVASRILSGKPFISIASSYTWLPPTFILATYQLTTYQYDRWSKKSPGS